MRPGRCATLAVMAAVFCDNLAAWTHAKNAPATAPATQSAVPAGQTNQTPAASEAAQADEGTGRVERWWDMNTVIRGWDGTKETLSVKGVSLDIGYTHVWQGNARGGLDTHNGHRHTGSYDVILQLDTDRAGLWKGGLFNVYLEGAFGQGVSETKVGDLLGVNGDAQTAGDFQVSTAWYEHKFLEDKLIFRLGKQDPTSDFDTNRYANNEVTQFLNNGLINNPTVPWSDYGLGVQAVVIPTEWFYSQIGVFDAEARGGRTGFDTTFHGPAHFFLIQESGFAPTFKRGNTVYPGTYRFGYWYDPTPKETFLPLARTGEPGIRSGDWGAYVSFDQLVFRENPIGDNEQGLGLFFRYGYAHGDVNTISNFYSYGLSYKGLVPSRDEDVLGAGIGQASLSEALGHVERGMEREIAIETFYNIHINKCIQLSPDLQFILDPGSNEDLHNSIVVGLRFAAYF